MDNFINVLKQRVNQNNEYNKRIFLIKKELLLPDSVDLSLLNPDIINSLSDMLHYLNLRTYFYDEMIFYDEMVLESALGAINDGLQDPVIINQIQYKIDHVLQEK